MMKLNVLIIFMLMAVPDVKSKGETSLQPLENFNSEVCKPYIPNMQNNNQNTIPKKVEFEGIFTEITTKKEYTAIKTETIGELASWGVGVAFAIAGITSVWAVVVPGVGVLSWLAGLYVTYKNNAEKKKFVNDVNSALMKISDQVNARFNEMEEYIDENTIALEKSLMLGEYRQMYSYLADCLDMDFQNKRKECVLDRCSYVKAGFDKFAIYYDDVVQPATAELKYKGLTKLQIRRIQANMVLFTTYVESLLVPCEYVLLNDMILRPKIIKLTEDEKSLAQVALKVKAESKTRSVRTKVLDYILAFATIMKFAYLKGKKELPERLLDVGIKQLPAAYYGMQCRFRMNNINFEYCDVMREIRDDRYTGLWKKAIKKNAAVDEKQFLKRVCKNQVELTDEPGLEIDSKDIKAKFSENDKKYDTAAKEIIVANQYLKLNEDISKLFKTLYDGFEKAATTSLRKSSIPAEELNNTEVTHRGILRSINERID